LNELEKIWKIWRIIGRYIKKNKSIYNKSIENIEIFYRKVRKYEEALNI
jgi:hypothetical protein